MLNNFLLAAFGGLSEARGLDFIYLYLYLFQRLLCETIHTNTLYNIINFCLFPLNHPRCFFFVLSLIFSDWEPLKSIYIMSLFLLALFSSCSSVIFQVNLVYIYLQCCEKLYQMLSPILSFKGSLSHFPWKTKDNLKILLNFCILFLRECYVTLCTTEFQCEWLGASPFESLWKYRHSVVLFLTSGDILESKAPNPNNRAIYPFLMK